MSNKVEVFFPVACPEGKHYECGQLVVLKPATTSEEYEEKTLSTEVKSICDARNYTKKIFIGKTGKNIVSEIHNDSEEYACVAMAHFATASEEKKFNLTWNQNTPTYDLICLTGTVKDVHKNGDADFGELGLVLQKTFYTLEHAREFEANRVLLRLGASDITYDALFRENSTLLGKLKENRDKSNKLLRMESFMSKLATRLLGGESADESDTFQAGDFGLHCLQAYKESVDGLNRQSSANADSICGGVTGSDCPEADKLATDKQPFFPSEFTVVHDTKLPSAKELDNILGLKRTTPVKRILAASVVGTLLVGAVAFNGLEITPQTTEAEPIAECTPESMVTSECPEAEGPDSVPVTPPDLPVKEPEIAIESESEDTAPVFEEKPVPEQLANMESTPELKPGCELMPVQERLDAIAEKLSRSYQDGFVKLNGSCSVIYCEAKKKVTMNLSCDKLIMTADKMVVDLSNWHQTTDDDGGGSARGIFNQLIYKHAKKIKEQKITSNKGQRLEVDAVIRKAMTDDYLNTNKKEIWRLNTQLNEIEEITQMLTLETVQ